MLRCKKIPNNVEPLYYGHYVEHMKYPDERGVLILEVVPYAYPRSWGCPD